MSDLNIVKIGCLDREALYSNGFTLNIDGVDLKCVQRIDIPIHMNEFIPVTVTFVPKKIEWINIDPISTMSVKTKGHFEKGAWVWDS